MPGFADSFWSNSDYAAGLGVLFGKLQQGVVENRQLLTVARMRAEAEEVYGQRLSEIAPTVDKIQGGFSRDDGASVRKAYEGVRSEMEEAAKNHRKIAQNIRDLVVNPFARWCEAHESRVQDSQDDLQARIKSHDKQAESVKKLRSHYFSKCRLVEDIEEENKLAFQDPESSPKGKPGVPPIPEIKVEPEPEVDDEIYEIGDDSYSTDQVKRILANMLENIKIGETKTILGTYQNTSLGTDIVEYLQKNMDVSSVSYAERIGQDLITNGFLRLLNVGNTFANSSKMSYQWKSKAFEISGVPEKKVPLSRTFSLPSTGGSDTGDSPVVGAVSEYLEKWNVINTTRPNETPAERMRREAREADEKYKAGVKKLDEMRCELEEAILVHLKFLERCELDRLKAVKTVVLDFSGSLSNVIPSLQSTVDNMMLYQETVQPAGDLRYLLENYRTGGFAPKVVVYDNYYNKVDEQTFGMDLEARARADRKRVPVVVTTILTYLDHHYPDLEGDEARRGVWLADVPLSKTHQLRARVNNGKAPGMEVFKDFDIPTVASLLKLYLLELPDSLVSSHVYEIIRTIYNSSSTETDQARVQVLQQTLSQLRLSNIATLDACMNHFTRLIDLTSADEEYIVKLATSLAPCVLRPKVDTSLTMEERHAYRLIRDLFTYKEAIFTELKRMSTQGSSGSVRGEANRPRAISTDESSRKANMEERNRLLLEKASGSRSRATSPAPSPRGHRRDKSSGGPETRFPVAATLSSPTATVDRKRMSMGPVLPKRTSLEVPDDAAFGGLSHPADGNFMNGAGAGAVSSTAHGSVADQVAKMEGDSSLLEKRNSLGRSGARFVGGRRVAPPSSMSVSTAPTENPGVTLVDRPMNY